MVKIPSIKEMEDFLLQDSGLDDMGIQEPEKDEPNKELSADNVRHDISVLARYLIRVYVGWPVHDEIVKRKVLTRLIKAYKSAHNMTATEFFKFVGNIIEPIPDNHISLRFNTTRAFTTAKTRGHKDVGSNIAGKQSIKTQLRDDNVAVIGFTKMVKTDEFRDAIFDFQNNILPKANALIIDLRGNGGGNSFYSDQFAYFLCGAKVDSMKKTFVRTTPEAQKVLKSSNPNASWASQKKSEKLQLWKKGKCFKIDKKQAYSKPIFILTDEHTGSSAEMFLLRMLHHPMVTVVGDNSRGMEVYGNMVHGFLPHSKLFMSVGANYRILEYDNFELHGHEPKIKCKDGQNALNVALSEYKNQLCANKSKQSGHKWIFFHPIDFSSYSK